MNLLPAARKTIWRMGRTSQELLQRTLASAGLRESEEKISGDSQEYWSIPSEIGWKAGSHWRDASVFDGIDLWSEIGQRHLAMFDRGARMVDFQRSTNRVLEWGCGGGANAVHFAPRAREFIGVDVSAASLEECRRQIEIVCDTPFHPVLIEVPEPEKAIAQIGAQCDLFLCFYVFELIPSQEYGARLLRIARDLLAPGGLALIQVKYDTGSWWTRPRRRAYQSGLAEMTTYTIESFWQLIGECGLRPVSVELVPKNELDERYAYFLMSKE